MPASQRPSCDVCYRRKIRCDRQSPCSNCARAGIRCSVPVRQPPRRVRYERSAGPERTEWEVEVLGRIQGLESVIQQMSGHVARDATEEARHNAREGMIQHDSYPHQPASSLTRVANTRPLGMTYERSNRESSTSSEIPGVEPELTNLVVDEGRSRYISDRFWAYLITEVC
jgi:hypothetical protein